MRDATFFIALSPIRRPIKPVSQKIYYYSETGYYNLRAPVRCGPPKGGLKMTRSRRSDSPCGRKSAACFRMPQESCGRQNNRLPSFSRKDGFLRGQPALIFRNVYSLIHLTGRPVFCCSA